MKESDVKVKKEIIINNELFGSVNTIGNDYVYDIPVQKILKDGTAYLINFEIYDEGSCRGKIQIEECKNDTELWVFDISCDSCIITLFKVSIDYYEFYKLGINKYKSMLKSGYIPTEFELKAPEYDDEVLTLKFVAWLSDSDFVTEDIASSSDWNMLIDLSEELVTKFPTLKNLIAPDILNF